MLRTHVEASLQAIWGLERQLNQLSRIGERLGTILMEGGRLLVVGNGGSAAEAQHLTAELVGRYQRDRRPFSALALHAETSSFTAIVNDYGSECSFARQVEAHGRPGDALLSLSTSGHSENVIRAVQTGRRLGLWTIALTGSVECPIAKVSEDVISVEGPPYAVQEAHLVAVHLLCESVDAVAVLQPTAIAHHSSSGGMVQ